MIRKHDICYYWEVADSSGNHVEMRKGLRASKYDKNVIHIKSIQYAESTTVGVGDICGAANGIHHYPLVKRRQSIHGKVGRRSTHNKTQLCRFMLHSVVASSNVETGNHPFFNRMDINSLEWEKELLELNG